MKRAKQQPAVKPTPQQAKARFSIVVADSQGQVVFSEIAELLGHGLRALGHEVLLSALPARGTRAIVLAPHLLRAVGYGDSVGDGDIVYNFEPTDCAAFEASLPLLLRAGVDVWDYSVQGTARLRELGVKTVQHVPVGYSHAMKRLRRLESDYDVLFYGGANDRRKLVLADMQSRGLRVRHLEGVYGQARDEAIERSKCVINIHYLPSFPTEDARLFYLLSNQVPVVSEGPPDEPRKRDWATWAPLEELANACEKLCAMPRDERERIGRRGFGAFSQASEKNILARALAKSAQTVSRTRDKASTLLFVQQPKGPSQADWLCYEGIKAARSTPTQYDRARDLFVEAIALDPNCVEAHMNLAQTLNLLGRFDEAIAAAKRAASFQHREMHPVYALLGSMLTIVGRVSESTRWFRRALEASPNPAYHSSFLMSLNYHPDYNARAILEEARRWDAAHSAPLAHHITPHTNDRSPDRRLRVGYVSPHFRTYSVSKFVLPVLRHHDRAQFEIFAYSNSQIIDEDGTTERLRQCVDHWRNIRALPDDVVAQRIRDDGVDVLVDLCGHMSDNRMLVFGRKPAPLQVFWIAYPGSTGLTAMTHRITDPFLDALDSDVSGYLERSLWLPETFWCYEPLVQVPPPGPLPARERGYVTFGSLNDFTKVGDEVLALWSRVMREVEGSRLLLLVPEGRPRHRVLATFNAHGIDGSRLEFVDQQPMPQYMATYSRIDVALDPYPVNGHTTSLDALFMGCPVVSLVGPNINGRGGLSILTNLGLPELIARTPSEYVAIAAGLANDLDRLAELRAGLRARLEKSPLMDAPRFTRNLEAAYRNVWRDWCATGESA